MLVPRTTCICCIVAIPISIYLLPSNPDTLHLITTPKPDVLPLLLPPRTSTVAAHCSPSPPDLPPSKGRARSSALYASTSPITRSAGSTLS
jgi:hypothetical protein